MRGTPRACRSSAGIAVAELTSTVPVPGSRTPYRPAPSGRVEDLTAPVRAAGRAGHVRQLAARGTAGSSPARGRWPSSSRGAIGCCCGTSSAWEQPRQPSCRSMAPDAGARSSVRWSVSLVGLAVVKLAQGRPPRVERVVVPVVRAASASGRRTRRTAPGSPPGTAATSAARAPPRPAGPAPGRAGRRRGTAPRRPARRSSPSCLPWPVVFVVLVVRAVSVQVELWKLAVTVRSAAPGSARTRRSPARSPSR